MYLAESSAGSLQPSAQEALENTRVRAWSGRSSETQTLSFWCSSNLRSIKYPQHPKHQHLEYLGPPLKERTLQPSLH